MPIRPFLEVTTVLMLVFGSGCTEPKAAPTPPPPSPIFEISPGAAALILDRQIALGLPNPFWFRLRVSTSQDRNAAIYQVDLVVTGPKSTEYEFASGGIRCLALRDQLDLLRNAVVDADVEEGVRGFRIVNPHLAEGAPMWSPSPEP